VPEGAGLSEVVESVEQRTYSDIRMSVIDSTEIRKKLMSADEAATVTGVSSTRLLELAEAGYAPCVRIDGGVPLFFKKDICSYVNKELTAVQEGKPLPKMAILNRTAPSASFEDLPEELHPMQESLRRWGAEFIPPCIYFLCADKKVVYVGQTTNLPARIATHYREKTGLFERVFFLPAPREQLNEVEAAFIAGLNPPLNGTSRGDGKSSAEGALPRPLKERQVEILNKYKVLGILAKYDLVDGFGRDVPQSQSMDDGLTNTPA
jgi:hypothetical protein